MDEAAKVRYRRESMKVTHITISRLGFIVAAAVLSLGLAGCGKQGEEAKADAPETPEAKSPPSPPDRQSAPKIIGNSPPPSRDERNTTRTPDTNIPPPPQPPPVPDRTPVTTGAIATNIKGYWVADIDATVELVKGQFARRAAEGRPVNQQTQDIAIAAIRAAEVAGKSVSMMFGEDGAWEFQSLAGPSKGSYKIMRADDKTGDFVIEIQAEGRSPKGGQANLTGDTLMIQGGEPIVMNRITKEELDKRKAETGEAIKKVLESDAVKDVLGNLLEQAPDDVKEQLKENIPPLPPTSTPANE